MSTAWKICARGKNDEVLNEKNYSLSIILLIHQYLVRLREQKPYFIIIKKKKKIGKIHRRLSRYKKNNIGIFIQTFFIVFY